MAAPHSDGCLVLRRRSGYDGFIGIAEPDPR